MAKSKFNLVKRIIMLLVVAGAVFSLFSLSAFAMAEPVNEVADAIETDNTASTEIPENTEGEEGDIPASESTDIVKGLFDDLKNNLPEILSALSLICTVILMIVYKSGFIPMVREGVCALSARVKSIGEQTDKMSLSAKSSDENIRAALEYAEKRLSTIEDSLSLLREGLRGVDAIGAKSDAVSRALSIEAQMLYELFMSSALPQYEKDRVGEMIAEMKRISEGVE